MNKKLILSVSGLLTVAFICDAVAANIRKGPYLLYPGNNTQMTVLWQLDGTQSCTLEWGEDTSYSDGSTGTTEYGSDHQHKHTITSLTPGTKYYYRVTVGASQYTGSFRSAPQGSATAVKFLAYGDTRTYPADHNTVCKAMVDAFVDDANYQSFTLHVGDWVNQGENESDWDNQYFNRSYSNALEMMANLPINGCIGNHEWDSGSSPPTYFDKYWPYPYVNGFYWSFDYGPVHVAVIDQYDESYSTGSAQHNWLTNDLANTTKEWKILQFHEPGYSAGGHGNNSSVQSYIQPLCETYNVDIVFCGHNHYYARCDRNGVKHITTGGGGAPLYDPDPGYPYLEAYSKNYHYCKIDIDGTQLDFETVKPDGTVIDSFILSHVLTAKIDSPADDSTAYYGEDVNFTGSASYGTPPYTYDWQSDVDGSLGSGQQIIVSDLGVHKVGSSVEPHTITLTVEDSNCDIDTAQIDLTVLFKADFEPDGDVDYKDFKVMADDWLGDVEDSNGLAGWWKFDEASGGTAYDSSDNNNTGTLYNMSENDWVDGKFDGGLDFDGSDDHVRVADSDSISVGDGDLSLSAWIYPQSISGERTVIAKVNHTMEKEYCLTINSGKILFEIERGANDGKAETSAAVVTTGAWQNIVVTYDSSTTDPDIYYNGQEQTIPSENITGQSNILSNDLFIGRRGGSYNDQHFDGLIDDVRIYDRVLSQEEIDELGAGVSRANLNGDDTVNFKDFVILGDDWLDVGY